MGIDGIDILKPDEFTPAPKVRERRTVSQHVVEQNEKKYVFGWDQPLMSFFLQIHDLTKEEDEEDRIPVWLGTPNGKPEDVRMYEVEELVTVAQRYGLHIPHETQVLLFGEKDDGV